MDWLRFHRIRLAVALTTKGRPRHQMPLEQLAEFLPRRSTKTVMQGLVGRCPEGMVGALRKLPRRFSARHYLTLVDLLNDRNAAKFIWQSMCINPRLIDTIKRLEPALRRKSLIDFLQIPESVDAVMEMLAMIMAYCPGVDEREVMRTLGNVKDKSGLSAWYDGWVDWHARPFPEPPVPEWENMKPLRSADAMRDAATRFRNCLKQKIGSVCSGRRYYYEWTVPEEQAICEVVRVQTGALWRIGQIGVVGNAEIDPRLKRKLCVRLLAAGFKAPANWTRLPEPISHVFWSRVDVDW
jgi:hypothetical protein